MIILVLVFYSRNYQRYLRLRTLAKTISLLHVVYVSCLKIGIIYGKNVVHKSVFYVVVDHDIKYFGIFENIWSIKFCDEQTY